MFNRTFIFDPGDTHVTKTVHRAPTDESIRLYREMEEKAHAAIVKAVKIEANEFKCVIHVCHDVSNDLTIARAVFDLNGKRFEVDADIRSGGEVSVLTEKLRDAISKRVANHLMQAFRL